MTLLDKIKAISFDTFKLGLHGVQGVMNTIAWILTIAVIAKPGGSGGGAGPAIFYYFFLTWITFLALFYQTVVQLWQRTRSFKNPYVSLGTDAVFTILWIGAFASVQVWANSGNPGTGSYCSDFAYGDSDKCVISYGTVIVGALIFVCFFIATGISTKNVLHVRKYGQRPSISAPKPVEARYVYPETTANYNNSRNSWVDGAPRDLEQATVTLTNNGTHPGRKLSWGSSPPPMTAPARPDFPEARPTFRAIDYAQQAEIRPLTLRNTSQRRNMYAPPRLEIYGPDGVPGHSPTCVLDYGGGLSSAVSALPTGALPTGALPSAGVPPTPAGQSHYPHGYGNYNAPATGGLRYSTAYGAINAHQQYQQQYPQQAQSQAPYPVTPSYEYARPASQYPATATGASYGGFEAPNPNPNPNINVQAGARNTFLGGYRSAYASGAPNPPNSFAAQAPAPAPLQIQASSAPRSPNFLSRISASAFDGPSRRSGLRNPAPGPATTHDGGYSSAYHTPLPSAMATPGREIFGQRVF